jgi:hypothetical protein
MCGHALLIPPTATMPATPTPYDTKTANALDAQSQYMTTRTKKVPVDAYGHQQAAPCAGQSNLRARAAWHLYGATLPPVLWRYISPS